MAKIIGSDNSGLRSFTPQYEYPVKRRQILRIAEDTVRPAGDVETADFRRPLHFTFQNPNTNNGPLCFLPVTYVGPVPRQTR